MLLEKLRNRLQQEFIQFRLYLTSASMTAEDLLNWSYEFVWKQEIVNLFTIIPEHNCKYSDELIQWILSRENALDFLYITWRHTDFLLTAEFADLLFDELLIRKEGTYEKS